VTRNLALMAYRSLPAWLVLAIAVTAASVGCVPSLTETPVPSSVPSVTALPTATAAPTASPTPSAGGAAEDPVAREIYLLARADLARRLGIDTEAVELVELTSVTWPDTGMGCPEDEGGYESIAVPGYRLVLRADDEEHIYHASFESAFYCDTEREVLPE
jgi:hypothetical protein